MPSRYLIHVRVFEEDGFWKARSDEMNLHISSNTLPTLYTSLIEEFGRQFAGKTGDLEISMRFAAFDPAKKDDPVPEFDDWI